MCEPVTKNNNNTWFFFFLSDNNAHVVPYRNNIV
jgi:hypothetical protein